MHVKPANAWIASSLLASAALLNGCAAGSSDLTLPPLQHYSEDLQAAAAAEIRLMPPPCPPDTAFSGCSAVKRLVIDYGDLRARIRAAGVAR